MKPHATSIGKLPTQDQGKRHENTVGKCLCGATVVWAFDDLYPEKALGVLIDAEPNPEGTLILWYEINGAGKAVGKQWFRDLEPKHPYDGPRWQRHACGRVRQ